MRCAESLRVQAYFDGELEAFSATKSERHSERCAECRALLRELGQVRSALRRDLTFASAPPALRARILGALDGESAIESPRRVSRLKSWRPQPFWKGAMSGIAGSAVAAGIAFFVMAPSFTNPVLDDLVGAHVRSLMPDHLIDVVSTDKHTVKPWFAGHTDVSPVVSDFDLQGYRLIGGRADYFEHQRAAVVVYQHGAHVVNVFSWAGDQHGLPRNTTRNGYHLAFWKVDNLMYCAVSDTAWDELLGLVRLLQELGARDLHPRLRPAALD
jgi:anti-sigma factor RsiW